MLTVKKLLRGRFHEELAHILTGAIINLLLGSFWGTVAPLARIRHVYCTVLQTNSPFLALQLESREEAESPGAVLATMRRPPSDVLDLILEFVYYELTYYHCHVCVGVCVFLLLCVCVCLHVCVSAAEMSFAAFSFMVA